jgi:hypothetical protein
VIGELISRRSLGPDDVRDMYGVFCAHFEGVTLRRFRADLDEKDWVIRIREGREVKGFSSLRIVAANSSANVPGVLYSGDTIVAPDARGTTILARTWIAAVRELTGCGGSADYHWLLLVSGFRTYRLLPVFWREFFPCYSAPTPLGVRAVMDSATKALFGDSYSAAEGIVRFPEPQRLRTELSCIPDSRLADPHVRFFVERNPGHVNGDELACWTRLSHDNLTAAGTRMWHAGDIARRSARLG